MSPDVGGMKRAEQFRQSLGKVLERHVVVGFMEKRRALGQVSGDTLFASVENRVVVLIDDLSFVHLSLPPWLRCEIRLMTVQ